MGKEGTDEKTGLVRGTASLLTCAWWPEMMTVTSGRRAGSHFTSSTSPKVLNRIHGSGQTLDAANCSLGHLRFFSFFSLPSSPPLLFSLLAVTTPSPLKCCFVKSTDHIQKRKPNKQKTSQELWFSLFIP